MSDDATSGTPSWSFETRQIHAGQSPDPTTGAAGRASPRRSKTSNSASENRVSGREDRLIA